MNSKRDIATIAGGIAAALGKGILIGTAGLLIAATLGATPLTEASARSILATAAVGMSCLIGAAIMRREQRDADDQGKCEARELMSLVRKLPRTQERESCKPDDEPGCHTSLLINNARHKCEFPRLDHNPCSAMPVSVRLEPNLSKRRERLAAASGQTVSQFVHDEVCPTTCRL